MKKLTNLVFLFLLVACEPELEVLSDIVYTKDPTLLRPVLFQPEDLGWPPETYVEQTYVFVSKDEVPPLDQMEVGMSAKPDPPKRKGPDPFNVHTVIQRAYYYKDEATAIEAYQVYLEWFSAGMGSLPEAVLFEPQLGNVLAGCRGSYGPELGNYRTCQLVAQHGRYVTTAYLPVDSKVVLMQDWENLINAIQDRMIAHVEQEASDG